MRFYSFGKLVKPLDICRLVPKFNERNFCDGRRGTGAIFISSFRGNKIQLPSESVDRKGSFGFPSYRTVIMPTTIYRDSGLAYRYLKRGRVIFGGGL